MKKKKIKKQFYGIELDFEGSLKRIIKMLKDYEKKYAKEGFFDFEVDEDREYDYDGSISIIFRLIGYRWETDEEFNKRIERSRNKV